MRGVSAGSRVWVKSGEEKEYGTIESIAVTQGFLTMKGSMVILMDDGHRVLATTMASRGIAWDLATSKEIKE
jgi:hypothetical protein